MTDDVIQRAAQVAHAAACGCGDLRTHNVEDYPLNVSFGVVARALAAAGLLAAPKPDTLTPAIDMLRAARDAYSEIPVHTNQDHEKALRSAIYAAAPFLVAVPDPDLRPIIAEMAAGLAEIAELVGLSRETDEPEVIINRVRQRLTAPADDEATKEAVLKRADELAFEAYRAWADTSNRDAYVDVAIRNAARGAALAALRGE